MKSMASSRLLTAWTSRTGSLILFLRRLVLLHLDVSLFLFKTCGHTYLLVNSRIARFDSCAMTRPLPSFCRLEIRSLMPFSRPPLRVGDFSLSTTSSKDTECLSSACKKSFLENSLTKMMSGAYGDLPLYEKRAFTRAFAVSSKFAVLSTIAAVTEPAFETS